MTTFENEKYLVEVHEVTGEGCSNSTQFIGNGLIAKYPDGRRALVTAKHVAFDGLNPRKVTIKTHPDFTESIPPQVEFKRRIDEQGKIEWGDVVEMPLPAGEGIPVGNKLSSDNLTVRASLHGHRKDVPVKLTNIGTTRDDQGKIILNSSIVHTEGTDKSNTIYPGFSGSGIFDENGSVIALVSFRKIGIQPSQASGFVIMTPRAGILEE